MLYSRSSLVIYFLYNSVYTSVPIQDVFILSPFLKDVFNEYLIVGDNYFCFSFSPASGICHTPDVWPPLFLMRI